MRITIAVLTAAVASLAIAAPASADPDNKNTVRVTLHCTTGTFTGLSITQNNALPFNIEGSTQVAVAQEISFVDDTGQTVVVRANPAVATAQQLVTCTYQYPGFPFLVTGHFLFTGAVAATEPS